MKIQIRVDDPKTREIWESALQAKAEVDSWPSWKRDLDPVRSRDHVRNSPMRIPTQGLCIRTLESVLRRIQSRIEFEETMDVFFKSAESTEDGSSSNVDPMAPIRLEVLRDLETELKMLMDNPNG